MLESSARAIIGVVVWVSAIQRFKKRCLDLDGNTKSKSKVGHYGSGSSIACNAVQFAKRNVQAKRFDECQGISLKDLALGDPSRG